MNNRTDRQVTGLRKTYEWHLQMAAALEFIGRSEDAAIHLRRARLLEPSLKQKDANV